MAKQEARGIGARAGLSEVSSPVLVQNDPVESSNGFNKPQPSIGLLLTALPSP
jgi:hypothetical protein